MAESWIGIRVSAALAILGSLVTLLAAGALAWMAFYSAAPQGESVPLKPMMSVLAVFFAGLTVWGIATGAGILRRRGWARLSIVIFAVLLVGMGASALVGVLFIRMPQSPELSGRVVVNVRLAIAAFHGSLAVIGAWWLLLFNSERAKRYFAETPAAAAVAPAKPLSVRIIAWYLLLCAMATAVAAVLRVPAVLFGAVITGWATLGIYTVFTAVELYLGTGLLQFQEPARLGALTLFAFGAANSAVSFMLPGLPERMDATLRNMPRFLRVPQTLPFEDLRPFAVMSVLLALVPIWFLLRRREAFR